MARKKLDSLPFEIEARIPIQLGRESISSSIVAISELVKNAYDADATEVTLKFITKEVEEKKNPSQQELLCVDAPKVKKIRHLVITDNGQGMNADDIRNHWLRIGTRKKTDELRSPKFNRVVTGAKGLGRLGLDRLSEEMVLLTKRANESTALEINVEWKKYEALNTKLSEILNDIYTHDLPAKSKSGEVYYKNRSDKGTSIYLFDLKDDWNEEFLSALNTRLTYLVSPFKKSEGFKIFFDSGNESLDGELSSTSYLDESLIKVEARLKVLKSKNENEEKSFVVDMLVKDKSGRKISEPINNEPWESFTSSEIKEPLCGALSFEMYFFQLGKSDIFESSPSREASKFFKKNYGLSIYRDHFRVLPYGEQSGKGDWLNISRSAQGSPGGMAQGGWKAKIYQLIGAVHISRIENIGLADQTNREGLVETVAFEHLQSFCNAVIYRFEQAAHEHARNIRQKNDSPVNKAAESLSKAEKDAAKSGDELKKGIDELKLASVGGSSESIRTLEEKLDKYASNVEAIKAASAQQKEAYEEQRQDLQNQKDTLSNLASIGILAIAFGHETTQDANAAVMSTADLKHDLIDSGVVLSPSQSNLFEILEDKTQFLQGFSSFYIESIKPSKRERKDINPFNVMMRIEKVLKPSLNRQNITLTITSDSEEFKVSAFEIDFESLFINLISNSIYALRRTPKNKRRINVEFVTRNMEKSLKLLINDSGEGIKKIDVGSIFNPMFSTKKNTKGQQLGTGMGLSIVKNIVVDHMGGNIRAVCKSELGGAGFEIKLPLSTRGMRMSKDG